MTSALTNQRRVIPFANSKQQFAEQLIWWRHTLVRPSGLYDFELNVCFVSFLAFNKDLSEVYPMWIAFLFLIVINLGNFKENECFLVPIWAQWESLTQFKSFIIRKWMAWMHLYLLTFKGKWIMEWNLKSEINVCALTRLHM